MSFPGNHAINEVMNTEGELTVRPVSMDDRQKLANLIHFEAYVHRHLDWRPPLDWIGYQPYYVAERRGRIVAALACPPDPPKVAWIRLFAASAEVTVERSWHALWNACREHLAGLEGVEWAAAIPLQHWFQALLERAGFQHSHSILMLSWERGALPPEKNLLNGVTIRPMNLDDLAAVEEIDAASFVPVWQNTQSCLELAFRQAAVATVAEDQDGIIAYQISTATPMGGHLARLAVHPRYQGQGIGYCLVRDMLSQFERRGAQIVTVNTQVDNSASLALYGKAGFRPTGEKFPIYQVRPGG